MVTQGKEFERTFKMLLWIWRRLFIQLLYCTVVKLKCSASACLLKAKRSPITSLCAFPFIIASQYLVIRVNNMPPWTDCSLRLLKNVQYYNYEDARQSGKTGKFVPEVNVWKHGLSCRLQSGMVKAATGWSERIKAFWQLTFATRSTVPTTKKEEMWPISPSVSHRKCTEIVSWLTTGSLKRSSVVSV